MRLTAACRRPPHRAGVQRRAAMACSAPAAPLFANKTVHLVRHGVTEMNEYLSRNRWDSPFFRDPLLYDTKLTASGERQASKLAARVERLQPAPQLLVASPLRRALRTADLAFADAALPRLVTPLCRERLYHSSDVGRAPGVVAAEFAAWKGFDQLQPVWWHTANGEGEQPDPLAHDPEPEDVFLQRCLRFRDWLSARPESCIAVVSHWGVIEALTCTEFSNCELRTYQLEELGVRAPRERLVPPG